MASKTTLQAVDDPSLAFDPIKVGGDVVLAQHAEVIRALGACPSIIRILLAKDERVRF